MIRPLVRHVLFVLLAMPTCGRVAAQQPPLPACEWCGAAEAPGDISATARIAPAGEAGVKLEITGVVRDADGRTLPGVRVYAYHTNARGVQHVVRDITLERGS